MTEAHQETITNLQVDVRVAELIAERREVELHDAHTRLQLVLVEAQISDVEQRRASCAACADRMNHETFGGSFDDAPWTESWCGPQSHTSGASTTCSESSSSCGSEAAHV